MIELTLKSNGKPILINTANITNIFQNNNDEVTICFISSEDYFVVSENYEVVKNKVLNGK